MRIIFLTVFMLISLCIISVAPAQIRTDSASIDSVDTRPVIIITGKLHETTFDVLAIDTLEDDTEEDAPFIIGGAVRFNYFVKSWEGQQSNRNKLGDMSFDLFRINVTGELGGIILNAEYRFYSDEFGGPMPHSAWAGYAFDEQNMIQLGLHQVPFGNQTYNSDNWFFTIPYYLINRLKFKFGIDLKAIIVNCRAIGINFIHEIGHTCFDVFCRSDPESNHMTFGIRAATAEIGVAESTYYGISFNIAIIVFKFP